MIEIVIADNGFLIRQGLKSILKGNTVKLTGEIKNSSNFCLKLISLNNISWF